MCHQENIFNSTTTQNYGEWQLSTSWKHGHSRNILHIIKDPLGWPTWEKIKDKDKKNSVHPASRKPEKAAWAKMGIPVDWKPERAVQAKVRDPSVRLCPVILSPAYQKKVCPSITIKAPPQVSSAPTSETGTIMDGLSNLIALSSKVSR